MTSVIQRKIQHHTILKQKITNKYNALTAEAANLQVIQTIIIPLKHLGNFWHELNMPLINCEVELKLKWNKNCVLFSKATANARLVRNEIRDAQGNIKTPFRAARAAINTPTNATVTVTDCKLYIPVVTLRAADDNKLLNSLKSGFKRTITWNKYQSTITNQAANNNLNYLIDPTFTKVHRLFVLAYTNEDDRTSYLQYYVPNIKIKNYNVIIHGKSFFELPVKNIEEAYQKIIDMGYKEDYGVGNLTKFEYFKQHYKLIAIDLSKQKELKKYIV